MSLDITFSKRSQSTGCYRTNGKEITTEEMLSAFPDYKPEYEEVWWRNITHNVGRIAEIVPVGNHLTLYNILWHPDETMFGKKNWNEVQPEDYEEFLSVAIDYISNHLDELEQYNPENGWGTAKGLLEFAEDMKKACEKYPKVDYILISI